MESVDAARAARAAAVAYFGTALAVTWSRPVLGGCARDRLPARFGANPLVVAFSDASSTCARAAFSSASPSNQHPSPRLTDPLSHVIAQRHARRRRGARRAGAPRRARRAVATAPRGSADPSRGDSLGPDLDAVPPEEWTREGDAQHHRGWLVLVSASAAPVPPEKPERGERAFATLANGVLRLARDRKSLDITAVNLEGCEVRLCGVPGAAADEPEHSWPANVRWRPKKDGAGKEKRWWKRLPIVVSHPERALYKGIASYGATRSATPPRRRGPSLCIATSTDRARW